MGKLSDDIFRRSDQQIESFHRIKVSDTPDHEFVAVDLIANGKLRRPNAVADRDDLFSRKNVLFAQTPCYGVRRSDHRSHVPQKDSMQPRHREQNVSRDDKWNPGSARCHRGYCVVACDMSMNHIDISFLCELR